MSDAGNLPSANLSPEILFSEREGYLEARFWATDSFDAVKLQFETLLLSCMERKPARLLLDMRALFGNFSFMQRYEVGLIGERYAAHVGRLAAVLPAALIDPERIGARVARNRGLMADVFTDAEEALRWLLKSD